MLSADAQRMRWVPNPPLSPPVPVVPDEVDVDGRAHFQGVLAGDYILSMKSSAGPVKTLKVSVPVDNLTVDWSDL